VGGNPRVLLLLFCLFCVILICFAGICPNMIRKKKEKKLEAMTRSLAWPVPVVARPCQLISIQKPIFFFFAILSTQLFLLSNFSLKAPLTANLQTFISPPKLHQTQQFLTQIISKHHSKHKPTNKTNFHPPNHKFTKFVNPKNLTQKPQFLHQSSSLNSKTLLKPQPHH